MTKRPRVTDAIDKDAEVEADETLVDLDRRRAQGLDPPRPDAALLRGRRSGQVFTCTHKATIETGLLQSFTGTLENGVVVALPEKELEPTGADAGQLRLEPQADRIVAVKLAGDQLTLYRTDGIGFPETVQFTKQ